MHPLTQVHIIKLDLTKEDEGERFGAVVVFPNKNSEIHSLKEWQIITDRADRERADSDKPYVDLGMGIGRAYDIFRGRTPVEDGPKAKNIPVRLVEYALNGGNNVLFTDQKGDAYIWTEVEGHREIMPIDDKFSKRLHLQYFKVENNTASPEYLRSAIGLLQAKAQIEGEYHPLYNRVAELDGDFWYYLGDAERRAVRINTDGWEVIQTPPILFKHHSHMEPQDEPIRVEGKDYLERFHELTDLSGNNRDIFDLMLITDLVPGISHIGLSLTGLPGSGKSTLLVLEKKLIDPSVIDILPYSADLDNLNRNFAKHHIVPIDNVSEISQQVSDRYCVGITGAATSDRRKYTDDEDYIRQFKIILRLNSISGQVSNSDLLSRLILMEKEQIDGRRRDEKEIIADLKVIRPMLLGQLFDLLSNTMKKHEELMFSPAPRMAGWYNWAESAAVAMGHSQEWFVKLFEKYEQKQFDEAMDQSSLAPLLEDLAGDVPFIGKATELLSTLKQKAEEEGINTRSKGWPPNPTELMKRVRPLIQDLKNHKVAITTCRYYELKRDRPDLVKGQLYGCREQDRMVVIERMRSNEPATNFERMNA